MSPDFGRILRDAHGTFDAKEPTLQKLFGLCSQIFKMYSLVGREDDEKFVFSDLESEIKDLNVLWEKIDSRDKRRVTQQFLAVSFSAIVECWGKDSSDLIVGFAETPREKRVAIANWLEIFAPAIYAANSYYPDDEPLNPREVQDALSALNAGESAKIFEASARKGREQNAHSLALKKMKFIKLVDELKATGLTAQKVYEIALPPLGVQRDTVRKWRAAAKRLLSPGDIARINQDHRHLIEKCIDQDDVRAQVIVSAKELRLFIGYAVQQRDR